MNIYKIFFLCFAGFIAIKNVHALDRCFVKPRLNVTVDVKTTGAVGDGITNDTIAFQKALDQVSLTGGTVTVAKGIYMIDAVVGIQIRSNTNLILANDSQLSAIPNGSDAYSILRITNAENVVIAGGILIGDRYNHHGKLGEWGMGMSIRGAKNVIIKELESRDNWGDGFYVSDESKNIDFCSVIADGNRRQGMSIISGENITVVNSVFKNTKGVNPSAGIDIEPNRGDAVKNARIVNSKFLNNAGPGIECYVSRGNVQATIRDIVIENNIMAKNGAGGGIVFNASNVEMTRNIFIENAGDAIHFDLETKGGSIEENVIYRKISGGHKIVNNGDNSLAKNIFR